MDIFEADDNSTPLTATFQKYAENILMLLEKQTQAVIQIC